ncbi:MAG TPA: zinc ribbon domain-containing protein [Bryobacteraceae bacterium]|nr:zinc ribbon domain-containing protein [Bryobacteraceae bacterium]
MPIYEYECRGCGEQFELLVLKGTVAACPACQSQDLEQLLSGFAVSSQEITRANVAAARKKYAASSKVLDQKIHEAEEVIDHTPSLQEKKVSPSQFIGKKKT